MNTRQLSNKLNNKKMERTQQIRDACVELERRINQTPEEYWNEELKGREDTTTSQEGVEDWSGATEDDFEGGDSLDDLGFHVE